MLNGLFSIGAVGANKQKPDLRSIKIALQLAKDKHHWNQTDFAKAMGVLPQDVTNWKSRGMPADWLEPVADKLKCSVDLLLGRETKTPGAKSEGNVVPISQPWPFLPVTREQYDHLPQPVKEQ